MADLSTLVALTRTLGEPHREYVIIGEGNTSTRIDDNTFYVKASGQQMETIDTDGFVAVNFDPVLELLNNPVPYTEEKSAINAAKVNPNAPQMPSVETSFHGMLLKECDVQFVGHTHPVTVNQILCSTRAEQFAKNRLFPDEAVLCGPESVFVPYTSPGLPLAVEIRNQVRAYIEANNEPPKVILLKSHGLIALGNTPKEILNITAMAVKAAKIFVGVCAIGEPVFMTREQIDTIYKRPDEVYRRKRFV